MAYKKAALALVLLVGLASCHRPPTVDTQGYGREYSGWGEYPEDEGARGAPGYHGPTGPGELWSALEVDERQAFANLASGLIGMIMRFVGPLLANLGIGTSNAIVATMLRKRLALIPEARRNLALTRPKMPPATVRAL